MKTRIHIGSLPGAYISRLNVDMLVAVNTNNSALLDAMGCKCVGAAFAKTTTGLELFDTRDDGFASAKYGLRIDMSLFQDGENVASILSAARGLGIKSLVVYIASPVQYNLDVGNALKRVAEWVMDNPGGIDDLYILANGWGIDDCSSCFSNVCNDMSMPNVERVGRVVEHAGRLWYYKEISSDMATVVHVANHSDHDNEKLSVPEMCERLRVVKIEDDAFMQTPADGDVSWVDDVKELEIPRYVSQVRPESILDCLPALEHVAIDPRNHSFEEDERMLIRRIA